MKIKWNKLKKILACCSPKHKPETESDGFENSFQSLESLADLDEDKANFGDDKKAIDALSLRFTNASRQEKHLVVIDNRVRVPSPEEQHDSSVGNTVDDISTPSSDSHIRSAVSDELQNGPPLSHTTENNTIAVPVQSCLSGLGNTTIDLCRVSHSQPTLSFDTPTSEYSETSSDSFSDDEFENHELLYRDVSNICTGYFHQIYSFVKWDRELFSL